MKQIRLFIASCALLVSFGGMLVPAVALAATPKSDACEALGSNASCTKDSDNSISLDSVIKVTLDILSAVVGIVAVIMIIIGGLRYITSSGDSNNISSAKNTIIYAIVGLVIVAMAQFIVQYVVGKVK